MDFGDAIKNVLGGYAVTRKAWTTRIENGNEVPEYAVMLDGSGAVVKCDTEKWPVLGVYPYKPEQSDMVADDWLRTPGPGES